MIVTDKDLVWNYLGYSITFGINIILLPLVLRYLTSDELGLWYVFSSIGVLITLFDFGFAPQLTRMITYAFAGASEWTKTGINKTSNTNAPNYELLGKIVSLSKFLYFLIAGISLIILFTFGSVYINHIYKNDFNINIVLAWIIYCLGCYLNLAYSFYNPIFKGIGKFVSLNKAIVLSRSAQFVVSFVLLISGFGILAVSIGYTVNTLVFRLYLAFVFRKHDVFGTEVNFFVIQFSEYIQLLKLIWHNASRDGLVTTSNYLVLQSNTILCSFFFGLEKTAAYALSVQIITFIASFSTIVYSTIQPILVEASLTNNIALKKQYYSLSWAIFFLSFWSVILLFVFFAMPLMTDIESNTRIDLVIFLLVSFYVFLQTNSTLSASYISTSNKLPYAVPFIISAMAAVVLAIIFAKFTNFGVFGLILAHLFVHLLYNMWKWPMVVFRELNTNPYRMFRDAFILIRENYLVKYFL
jgi:O-antigen/teichoic acid export membrane protein